MKKLTTILLTGVTALAFTACGSSDSSGGSSTPPPTGPIVTDSGYSARDDATPLFNIAGNSGYYLTDNKCVYPTFIHTDFYYEVYEDNTVRISYGDKEYNCNVTKTYIPVTPTDGPLGADYVSEGSFIAILYYDADTNIYYDVERPNKLDKSSTTIIEIKNNGNIAEMVDGEGNEESKAIVHAFTEE